MTEYFEEVYLPDDCFMLIKLDMNRIRLLKLEVDANSIQWRYFKIYESHLFLGLRSSIFFSLCTCKLKIKPAFIQVISETIVIVKPAPSAKSSMYHVMQFLKEQLPRIVIKVRY